MYQDLINLFRSARIKSGLMQSDIARKLHISTKAYSKIESGRNALRFEYIKPICDKLNIPYLTALQHIIPITMPAGKDTLNGILLTMSGDKICVHRGGLRFHLTPEEDAMYRLMADYFCMDLESEELCDAFLQLRLHRITAGNKNFCDYFGKLG